MGGKLQNAANRFKISAQNCTEVQKNGLKCRNCASSLHVVPLLTLKLTLYKIDCSALHWIALIGTAWYPHRLWTSQYGAVEFTLYSLISESALKFTVQCIYCTVPHIPIGFEAHCTINAVNALYNCVRHCARPDIPIVPSWHHEGSQGYWKAPKRTHERYKKRHHQLYKDCKVQQQNKKSLYSAIRYAWCRY